MNKNLPIIALDFNNSKEALNFLDTLNLNGLNLKVGMELFFSSGNDFIKKLTQNHHKIFLDLKLHDIPNTVERAMSVLATTGVSMVNVHASGGKEMMLAAKRGLEKGAISNKKPLLIAVTQLTSTSDAQLKTEQLVNVSMQESVLHYATLAKSCELDGVVCSPHEVPLIKSTLGPDFLTVTPGIRLNIAENNDDQVRIMTVKQAKAKQSDFIVVGRPITQSKKPQEIYEKILSDWRSE